MLAYALSQNGRWLAITSAHRRYDRNLLSVWDFKTGKRKGKVFLPGSIDYQVWSADDQYLACVVSQQVFIFAWFLTTSSTSTSSGASRASKWKLKRVRQRCLNTSFASTVDVAWCPITTHGRFIAHGCGDEAGLMVTKLKYLDEDTQKLKEKSAKEEEEKEKEKEEEAMTVAGEGEGEGEDDGDDDDGDGDDNGDDNGDGADDDGDHDDDDDDDDVSIHLDDPDDAFGKNIRLAWSPDGKFLASGNGLGSVFIWRIVSWSSSVRLTRLNGHSGPITKLVWSDRSFIDDDDEDNDNGNDKDNNTMAIRQSGFRNGDGVLVSASTDGTLRVWDVSLLDKNDEKQKKKPGESSETRKRKVN